MNPLYGKKRWDSARSKCFLRAHREVFDLEEEVESVMMRLRSSTHSTDQNQRSAAGSPSSITNGGVWQTSGTGTLGNTVWSASPP